MGFSFLTTQNWYIYSPQHFGIAALLPLGILIAADRHADRGARRDRDRAVHLRVLAAALRRPLIAVIDLMAAIPRIIFGVWGLFFLSRGSSA